MGVSDTFPIAFAKSQLAAGTLLPRTGRIFISVADRAKDQAVGVPAAWPKWVSNCWPRAARPAPGAGRNPRQRLRKLQRATPTSWT